MKTLLKVICETAFITEGSKNLNIIGIFEGISAPNFPATHPKLSCVISLSGEPSKTVQYFPILKGPDGTKILDGTNSPMSMAVGINGKLNLIFNLVNVPLPKPGVYIIELNIGDLKEEISFIAQGPNA